jgi:phytol kinase
MNFQLLYCFLFLLGYTLIVILCEFLHKKGIPVEYTRKLAHCFSCLLSLLIPVFFCSHWYISGLVIIAFSMLYTGYRKQLFASINSVSRKTCGAYLLPVSIGITYYISLFLHNSLFFILPVVVLAISDPLACCFGKKYGSKILKSGKTAMGTLIFFLSSFIICSLVLWYQSTGIKTITVALGVSIIASGIELLSPNGSDNITVPLSVIVSFVLFASVL